MTMSAESDEQTDDVETPEPVQGEQEQVAPAVEEVREDTAVSQKSMPLSLADVEDAVEDQPPARPPKKQRRPSTRSPRKNQPTLQQVTARFAACGRCSYLWAGYRVIRGSEELETAVAESKSGWLELVWDMEMPELIHKSYGVRLDISYYHYEGCCQECRRHFIYQAAKNETGDDTFRIEISPRMAK